MEEIKPQDIYTDVSNEMFLELEQEKMLNEDELKQKVAHSRNLLIELMKKMVGKLIIGLKIKITVIWRGKVLFEYVVPKN